MFGGIIPRASSAAIKNACLLTLHWCNEVLFPDFWWQFLASQMGPHLWVPTDPWDHWTSSQHREFLKENLWSPDRKIPS